MACGFTRCLALKMGHRRAPEQNTNKKNEN
jgi:hypothetical protein